ncbi:MAG: hypothetical protein LLF98_12095 [Clostridium sp.]|uniref:hypothetical protein n=1 Tax=Clostridium sp. TaxID=1506 RepID=UPI0025BE82BA|nr:hypothetical protein [Clostridium sp.]MCE5221969.1 hypothetical protein [Clostridium sp.]
MRNIKKKFENETKTRINIIGSDNSRNFNLQKMLVKQGVFEGTSFVNDNGYNVFPTEILCSSPKNNSIIVYLSIKNEEEILKELKENILRSINEAYLIFVNENISESIKDNEERKKEDVKKAFNNIMQQFGELSLNKFYEIDNIEMVFEEVKFDELFDELKKINYTNDYETLVHKDNLIWKNYFDDFQVNFKKQYHKWMKRISKYYVDNEYGYGYINQEQEFDNKYLNINFYSLCNILYGIKSSCALMIERAYIEAPSSNGQYSGSVYIDYTEYPQYRSIAKTIESRIGEDYKELFIIVAKSSEEVEYFSKFKENVNKVTLDKRIFCILNEFDFYRDKLLKDKNIIKSFLSNKEDYEKKLNHSTFNLEDNKKIKQTYLNDQSNLVDALKFNVSKTMGISQDKIIVTEQFKDIDKNSLNCLDTNDDFLKLLRLIKLESENVGKVIKIKPSSKETIISISLNQERMSVQALMGMFYERYHGYLVNLWNKIIENEESSKVHKKYYYSAIRTIIRNRKDNYKEYKDASCSSLYSNSKRTIDFSLRSGDYNDSKKILKMLVNYGYHTVGFDSNENKILVNVNGEISEEDKDNLIKSIKGRLEECAINYFENAFLMDVSRKKIITNSLYKALESEKNITIDDFYSAFKEMFKKMSENIIRYEVYLQ